jgi:hypothetical protein
MPLSEAELAELEAIDATLRGESVDPGHAELAELALQLTTTKPSLPVDAAARLDAQAAQRFGVEQKRRAEKAPRAGLGGWLTLPGWSRSPGLRVAVGTLATLVIVFGAIVITGHGGAGSSSSTNSPSLTPAAGTHSFFGSSSGAAGDAASAKSASSAASSPASSASSPTAAAAPPAASPEPNGRRITQSAQLQLTTPSRRIEQVAHEVFNAIGQVNGIVKNSQVTAGGSGGYASFTLSIPTGNLQTAMTDLSKLPYASVASRSDQTQDVNDQYLNDQRALADARAQRTALLKQLDNATTTAEIDSLTAQIHDAEASIKSDESTLNSLNGRISYSPLAVQVNAGSVPVPPGGHAKGSGGLSLHRAAHDALRVLETVAGAVLIGLAALVPIAAVLALLAWVSREWRRRRREQALDAA